MSEFVRVGEIQVGNRGRLELGVVAADPELGELVVLERINASNGETLFVVPEGKTFVGTATLVLAIGESGRFAIVDATGDLCGGEFGNVDSEPLHSDFSVAKGREPLTIHSDFSTVGRNEIRIEAAGRCVALLRGYLR